MFWLFNNPPELHLIPSVYWYVSAKYNVVWHNICPLKEEMKVKIKSIPICMCVVNTFIICAWYTFLAASVRCTLVPDIHRSLCIGVTKVDCHQQVYHKKYSLRNVESLKRTSSVHVAFSRTVKRVYIFVSSSYLKIYYKTCLTYFEHSVFIMQCLWS